MKPRHLVVELSNVSIACRLLLPDVGPGLNPFHSLLSDYGNVPPQHLSDTPIPADWFAHGSALDTLGSHTRPCPDV